MKTFAAAWRFLTVLPGFGPAGDDEVDLLRRSPGMFPLVGVVLGLLAACVAWAAGRIMPGMPAAALIVAALAMFSCGFHLDGLTDCADALMSPGRDREKSLAIMKDSRIGAHGALALALILLVKFACLASLPEGRMVSAAFVMPVAGRAAMLFSMTMLPYARAEGLGGLFVMAHPRRTLWWGIIVAVAGMAAINSLGAWLALAVLWVGVNLGWVWFLRRRLGGATGDCYGAACELSETTVAVGACLLVEEFFPGVALFGFWVGA